MVATTRNLPMRTMKRLRQQVGLGDLELSVKAQTQTLEDLVQMSVVREQRKETLEVKGNAKEADQEQLPHEPRREANHNLVIVAPRPRDDPAVQVQQVAPAERLSTRISSGCKLLLFRNFECQLPT